MLEGLWWPQREQGSSLYDCSLSHQRSVWNIVRPERLATQEEWGSFLEPVLEGAVWAEGLG